MAFRQNPEKSHKFYLAHDIANLPLGTRFLNNPPHITLAPPAYIEPENMPNVEVYLQQLATQTDEIALSSMGFMFVGHRDTPTPATRFTKTPELATLHEQLIDGLGKRGCEFVSLEWTLTGYQPHCEAILLDEDKTLTVNNVTIYTKRPHPSIRGLTEITNRYQLGNTK